MSGKAVNRRGFIAGSTAAMLAAQAAAAKTGSSGASRIGVTTVSLRDRLPFRLPGAPPPAKGSLDLLGAPAFAAKVLGLRKLELWSLQFAGTTPDYCAALRAAAKRSGVRFINVQLDSQHDLGAPDAALRANAVADTRAWIDRAALIGAPSIRANLSGLAPKYAFDAQTAARSFRELADYAAGKKVMLLTENHFGHSVAIENVVALLKAVDHPNFRTVLDWGNIPSATTALVIEATERLEPWLHLVSAKGVSFDADYKATNYDVTAIVRATEKLGYRGDYSIELFGPPSLGFDPVKAIAAMRAAIAKAL